MSMIGTVAPAEIERAQKHFEYQKRHLKPTHNQKIICDILKGIRRGRLTLRAPYGVRFDFTGALDGPQVQWNVQRSACFDQILYKGSLGLGESFVEGAWDIEDDRLCDFFGIILLNDFEAQIPFSPWQALRLAWFRWRHNTFFRSVAKRCVQSHYDLSNEFYALVLDPNLTYSCGIQFSHADSLQQMQQNKHELICRKLDLARARSLLDIGCGWGAMLIYAAQKFPNLRCYGVTLSQAQYELANRRVQEQGLQARVKIELRDFRDVQGHFDRVVSIGMFEHLSRSLYGTFMRKVASLLEIHGLGLLHCIGTLDPPRMAPDGWVNSYVFPGTRLPRLHELTFEIASAGLNLAHMEDFKPHYALTLRKWKENFDRTCAKILQLSPCFNEKFRRLWNYYLQTTEAGFRYGNMELYQLLLSKGPGWSFPKLFKWF